MSVAFRSLMPRLRSRTGWIGIDIGTHSVKLAQLEMVDGSKRLADAVVLPFPESGQLTADSLRTGWLARMLHSARPRFRGRMAACGVSMSVTDFRSMTIPPGSPKERREMIAQELMEGAHSSTAIEFDYWDDAATEDGSAVNVLAVAEPLTVQIAEATQAAGLHCSVLDGGPFALARAVELMSHHAAIGHPQAVLDWGHRVAHLAIIVDGQPVFSRVLKDCEVGPLVEAVARGLGLTQRDGCELLTTYGVPDPQEVSSEQSEIQELVVDLSAKTFERLTVEIDKTLQFLSSHRPELVPSELILLGGGATIRNAEAKLALDLRLPVSRWQLPLRPAVGTSLDRRSIELFAHAAALSDLGWES